MISVLDPRKTMGHIIIIRIIIMTAWSIGITMPWQTTSMLKPPRIKLKDWPSLTVSDYLKDGAAYDNTAVTKSEEMLSLTHLPTTTNTKNPSIRGPTGYPPSRRYILY